MNNELWLTWKEPFSCRRYKIGILTKDKNSYKFYYTNPELDDARKVGFKYYPGFDNLTNVYESEYLFANISTRLPNSTRPDYLEILNCYNLEKESDDFEILKATRGRTLTDSYEFVPAYDLSKIEFYVAGTSHSQDINECKKYLSVNKKIYLEPEPENKNDKNAIKVVFKENNKSYNLGYVPRYYSKDLLNELNKDVEYSALIKSLKLDSEFSDENITVKVKIIFNY